MATIIEGTQYALNSSLELNNKNQSVVFVKLTDSALKAIEDYTLAISKIITIPNCNENEQQQQPQSNDDKKAQCFNFSTKDIQNDGGILECVRQTSMSMESLGKIMLRMQIHANDDVYQKTKVKMAVAAEQESKKYNTKVIELSGRKVKAKKPYTTTASSGGGKFTGTNNSTSTGTTTTGSKNSLIRFNKFTNNNNNNNNVGGNLQSKLIPAEHLRKVRELLIQLLVTKSCNKPVELIPKVQERFKELPIDKQQIIQILNTIATFKEGIYQLNELAVAEEALQQFGTEKRNNGTAANVSITVNGSGIGSINNNNSSISPFSDHSAKSISSPNSLNTSPSTLASSNHKHSPYTNNGGVTVKSSMKRSGSDFLTTTITAVGQKKFKSDNIGRQNIATAKSTINNQSAITSSYSPFDKVQNQSEQSLQHDSPDIVRAQNNSYLKSSTQFDAISQLMNGKPPPPLPSSSLSKESNNSHHHQHQQQSNHSHNQRHYGNGSGSMNSTPNSSPDSDISHVGNVASSDSSQNNDADDYLSKYPKIKDMNQLIQYRRDFEAEFPEYKKLYEYVEGVARQFEELKERIQAKEEESDEWHELIRQIFDKYDEVKNRSKYQRAQKRLIYLHYKLLHIKNQITEYYRNNGGGCSDKQHLHQTSFINNKNSQLKLS
ncbi:hypothetical protein DERF_010481 [Dermatophagoides farinae]|uniref:OCEL domain-containing protein n=1 Tax=Dermatophagoides farinae TaxID=6954 RepID=A0A922HYI1_DERFA|nr:hypothetical protein DERF_010481 [Dermatophagoides farinae]